MGTANINAESIFDASWVLPRNGVWVLDGIVTEQVPHSLALGVRATVRLGLLAYSGTVRRSGSYLSRQNVNIVGGAGGLASVVPAFSMRNTVWRTIVLRLLASCGEVLSPDSNAALLSQPAGWTVTPGTAGPALESIVTAMSPLAVWRFRPDGTVWIGIDTFAPVIPIATAITNEQPEQSMQEMGPANPQIEPGQSINGRPVYDVTYYVRGPLIRQDVFYAN